MNPFPSNLFLLNVNNKGFLHGLRRLPIPLSLQTVGLSLALFALLIVIVRGAGDVLTTAHLLRDGATTQGEIVEYQRHVSSSLGQGLLYPVTYRYSLPGSDIQLNKVQFVCTSALKRIDDGMTITVK